MQVSLSRTKTDLIVTVVYVDDAMFFGKNKTLVMKKKQEFMDTWECLLGDKHVSLVWLYLGLVLFLGCTLST